MTLLQVGQESEYDVTTQIQGLVLLEGRLVIYSQKNWHIYDMTGNRVGEGRNPQSNCIQATSIIDHFESLQV